MLLSQILFGAFFMGLGVLMLKYSYQIVGWVGHPYSVERYLGSGSIYLVIKLLGLLVVLGGILHATGLLGSVVNWLLSPLTNLLGTGQ